MHGASRASTLLPLVDVYVRAAHLGRYEAVETVHGPLGLRRRGPVAESQVSR